MEERFYRNWINNSHLKKFKVTFKETDLLIRAPNKYPQLVLQTLKNLRGKLEKYIKQNNEFYKSLKPISVPEMAPLPVRKMAESARKVNVGPMAAVAGLFAEKAGREILKKNEEVIVENGGDIFLSVNEDPVIGIYAGEKSPFTGKLGFKIAADNSPLGICTSAGTIGPSLSKGKADAVIVISSNTTLADAAATAYGNMIKNEKDIDKVIEESQKIEEISGIIIVYKDNIGIKGSLELVKMN